MKKCRWILENISEHWISIFTWRKMVIHQLESASTWKQLSTSWSVCDFIADDLRQCEASSLILSPFPSLCVQMSLNPASFPSLSISQKSGAAGLGERLCRTLAGREVEKGSRAGGKWHQCQITQGMGWALQLVDALPCLSNSIWLSYFLTSRSHTPGSPSTQFQIFVKSSVKATRSLYILQKLMTKKSQTVRHY